MFLTCFTPGANHFDKPNKANVNRIYKTAIGEQNTGKDIKFREGMEERAAQVSLIHLD